MAEHFSKIHKEGDFYEVHVHKQVPDINVIMDIYLGFIRAFQYKGFVFSDIHNFRDIEPHYHGKRLIESGAVQFIARINQSNEIIPIK